MSEVEPEFDVNERDSWYALWEYETAVCPKCGNLRSVCENPEGLYGEGFYPQRSICWITASQENTLRRWRQLHEKARPDEAGYLPTDGTTIWVSTENLTPDDDFLEESVDGGP